MKRQKKLTKRERKALNPRPAAPAPSSSHIHCVACGRHLDPREFSESPVSASYVTCDHGSRFPCCVGCLMKAEALVAEHDRTNQPVRVAQAWH
ncbi:MAG TPA: hypothetical protein VKZ49_18470 [Polyangiaceae bacterium]|nr:hypothetical protein [Polyangiaceae bacterium]